MAIYYSGGEKSWLFFLLMVRTADQTRTAWRNTLLFAIASTVGYALLLVYLGYFEHRTMSLPAELTKVFFIFASNMYLARVAKAADYLRNQMKAAIRVSRDLIRQLETQSSALQASERDYRALVEGSIQGIIIHQQGVIQLANPAFTRIFGYESPDVLIGLDYMTLVARDERDRIEGYRAARVEGLPAPERYEFMGVRRDGTFVRIECMASHTTWRGAPAVLATLQDITARRQAEESLQRAHMQLEARVEERTAALRRSQRQLADIIDFFPDATFVIDNSGTVIAWNRAMEEMSGISKDEMIGKGDFEYSLPFFGSRRPILIDLVFASEEKKMEYYDSVSTVGGAISAEFYAPEAHGGNSCFKLRRWNRWDGWQAVWPTISITCSA